jgi:hypothetical protein
MKGASRFNHQPKEGAMLGFGSVEIALVFWLCIFSAVVCVVYGVRNWNNKGTPDKVKVKKTIVPK